MITVKVDENWREQDFGNHRGDKSVCLSRYGGFGDAIQTAALIKTFKDAGWYVAVNVTESAHNTLRNDPHIDEFIVQTTDQIANKDFGEYWHMLSQLFSKFSILSESVEGSLLALPYRVAHSWSSRALHKYMNWNYVEFMHDIAGIEYKKLDMRFYPTAKEEKWANTYRAKLGKKQRVVLIPLSGSSFHKVYPHIDAIISALLYEYKDVKVVLVGDEYCKVLEQGWEKEKRVICKSGKWSIRETLAFARLADIVIGPETGVLNAVACEENTKIVFLSHSSENNLTRDWTNTISIVPYDCPCHPCHKLHVNTITCNLDDNTNQPLCVEAIKPETVYGVLQEVLDEKTN